MKNTFNYMAALLTFVAAMSLFNSCEDMLDTDSSRIAFEEDNQLKSPNDSIYSVMGILSKFQEIGQRYVLLGELRGDLMSVSQDASFSLKEVNEFNISSENEYLDKRDYYTIINNCNYAITRMDTAINIRNEKVMLPEFAAIKAIRAWTYFQLALTYGEVKMMTEPILDYESALKELTTVTLDQLVPILITDLQPYIDVRNLDYGTIDEKASPQFFIPIPMLLGDLYLFVNRYEEAAAMYHKLIVDRKYTISSGFASYWQSQIRDRASAYHSFAYGEEVITTIAYSSDKKDRRPNLVNMSYNDIFSIKPTATFVDDMALRTYFHATRINGPITAYLEGDLRGAIIYADYSAEQGDAFASTNIPGVGMESLITKYLYNAEVNSYIPAGVNNGLLVNEMITTSLPIYRYPHLYLRYAEALNRAGKPSLAFAVLKYGLDEESTIDPAKVSQGELAGGEPYLFLPFTVGQNIGTASRGRGLGIPQDKEDFVIPDFTQENPTEARQDSIDWVELRILEEMAAETSFEGNRFFDLLRISRHRADHPTLMAELVARKFENEESMKNKLMNLSSWFVK